MSLNTKLFQLINNQQGKNKVVDFFADFFAQYFIVVQGSIALFFMGYSWSDSGAYWFISSVATVIISFIMSYLTGIVYKKPRPIVTQKNVKQLFPPFGTWKSFPSDHTVLSSSVFWTVIFANYINGDAFDMFFILIFAFGIIMIGLARIFSGVHYPLDIIGGFLYSGIACYIATILIPYLYLIF